MILPNGREISHDFVFSVRLSSTLMNSWRIALLGDSGVGKTALAVQVSEPYITLRMADSGMQFSLTSFVG